MTAHPIPMIEIFRGSLLESLHMGHAVVVRPSGEIVEAWGDPDLTVFPRSSAKILQALPLLESGAGKNLSTNQLALACSSHSGELRHVDLVTKWLGDLELDDHAFCCGPEASRDVELRETMIRKETPVTRTFNNCSGKHAGFLTLTKHLKAGPNYVDPGHPVQAAVREAFEAMTGEQSPGFGIDGCSAPNFATSLKGLAQSMAKCAVAHNGSDVRSNAAATLTAAMIAHPEMVAGNNRACTALMKAAKGKAAIKTGAEGVYIAILPELELGVALKISDGATRASEIAIAALLVYLGVLDRNDPIVAAYLRPKVRNWDGLETGWMQPAVNFLA